VPNGKYARSGIVSGQATLLDDVSDLEAVEALVTHTSRVLKIKADAH